MTRVLVTGGRSYNNYTWAEAALMYIYALHGISAIGHGQCHLGGADFLAGKFARKCNIPEHAFPVNNSIDGKWPHAGNRRNVRMFAAFQPDVVLIFKGGSGTSHMTQHAVRQKLRGHPVRIYSAIDERNVLEVIPE